MIYEKANTTTKAIEGTENGEMPSFPMIPMNPKNSPNATSPLSPSNSTNQIMIQQFKLQDGSNGVRNIHPDGCIEGTVSNSRYFLLHFL